MNMKDNFQACHCNQENLYFNVSITSQKATNVSSRSRLSLELLRLVPISVNTCTARDQQQQNIIS